MIVVLNEWVFHDLWGENGDLSQRETALFLRAFVQSDDSLVVPNEVRWSSKANRLMEFTDTRRRLISKVFRSLYDDSERALRVRPGDATDIPGELLAQLPEEDVYLVEAYLSANADVLVTTDVDLHGALVNTESITCRMRDDFLADYRS